MEKIKKKSRQDTGTSPHIDCRVSTLWFYSKRLSWLFSTTEKRLVLLLLLLDKRSERDFCPCQKAAEMPLINPFSLVVCLSRPPPSVCSFSLGEVVLSSFCLLTCRHS